jgi:hypothetical protein
MEEYSTVKVSDSWLLVAVRRETKAKEGNLDENRIWHALIPVELLSAIGTSLLACDDPHDDDRREINQSSMADPDNPSCNVSLRTPISRDR